MTEEKRATINIDGEDVFVDELPQEAQYVVVRMQETGKHRDAAAQETELYNMAIEGYIGQLRRILAPQEEGKTTEEAKEPAQEVPAPRPVQKRTT